MKENNSLMDEDLKNENLHEKAQYTKCDTEHEEKIKLIRFAFSEMYKCFDQVITNNREASLAYTKMEEAQMWAIKSITREKQENLDESPKNV